MAQRIANRMAIAMALAYVRDMAHSTPLQTTCKSPSHSFFSSAPGARDHASITPMRTAATGGGR